MIDAARFATVILWTSIGLASVMIVAVVVERTVVGALNARQRRLERRYRPLIDAALARNEAAFGKLASIRPYHRIVVARLLLEPLIVDRQPARIAGTRAIAEAMALIPVADRYLRSPWWWRRSVALRVFGAMQFRDRISAMVAALDDPRSEVRAAALDALTDTRDPESFKAVIVRLHDPSLHRGRLAGAVTAFGPECETFLLDLAAVDSTNRFNYARALSLCGTARARSTLGDWIRDERPEVRAASFEALGHIGLDDTSAQLARHALECDDEPVRAMAAFALQGWTAADGSAACLAMHLDDAWPVAIRAARSLRSMGASGVIELQTNAARPDLAGVLARQMLWQAI
jgi:hypothetical protein